jgi:hypothetical protein
MCKVENEIYPFQPPFPTLMPASNNLELIELNHAEIPVGSSHS